LEAAEKEAGIGISTQPKQVPLATNLTYLKDEYPFDDEKIPASELDQPIPEDMERMIHAATTVFRRELEAISKATQKASSNFPMSELKFNMAAAGAWPPAGDDLKLSPSALLLKYKPRTYPIK